MIVIGLTQHRKSDIMMVEGDNDKCLSMSKERNELRLALLSNDPNENCSCSNDLLDELNFFC
jgi:hypothetical protein